MGLAPVSDIDGGDDDSVLAVSRRVVGVDLGPGDGPVDFVPPPARRGVTGGVCFWLDLSVDRPTTSP